MLDLYILYHNSDIIKKKRRNTRKGKKRCQARQFKYSENENGSCVSFWAAGSKHKSYYMG
jgi:hypothetical protein